PQWLHELGRFALSRVFGTALNAAVSLGVLWEWPEAGRTLAVAAGTLVALTVNYLTSKHWAYKNPLA
ncbi:MAG: GtrA family protein, partial [Pseudomonadota bacterium]